MIINRAGGANPEAFISMVKDMSERLLERPESVECELFDAVGQ